MPCVSRTPLCTYTEKICSFNSLRNEQAAYQRLGFQLLSLVQIAFLLQKNVMEGSKQSRQIYWKSLLLPLEKDLHFQVTTPLNTSKRRPEKTFTILMLMIICTYF